MAFFTSFKPDKAGQAIFITNYKKMKVNNLADETDSSFSFGITSSEDSVDDNVFRGDLTIGRNAINRKFTFKYFIRGTEDDKQVIRIVSNSASEGKYDNTFTTSVGWYPISKNGLMKSGENVSKILLACRKIGGTANSGADALSELFAVGEAFFLGAPEGLPKDCILDPEQMVPESIKQRVCNVMTKFGKRMYSVDGPRSEFYIRCKMFKKGNISNRHKRKYITENDKQILETYPEELNKKPESSSSSLSLF